MVHAFPQGLLFGDAAAEAVGCGFALPFQGRDNLAFTQARVATEAGCTLVTAPDFSAWIDQQPREIRERLQLLLARLTAPVAPPSPRGRQSPLVMGILNVTPDSFSDGARYFDAGAAIEHGRRLWHEGADWIDVGGESTRPGAEEVPPDEEILRVVPVIRELARDEIAVSIDTRKAVVMEAAIAAGARMINDVSALRFDLSAATVARSSRLPLILMHSRGTPAIMQQHAHYAAAASEVFDELSDRVDLAENQGIARTQILIDPGIGFAKTLPHNIDILQSIGLYAGLGAPIVVGVSRKSMIGQLGQMASVADRLPGSLAAAVHAALSGVAMIRAHDVAATRQALDVTRAFQN